MNNRKPATPLKLAIVASGIPQKDIAERLSVDPGQLSRIVNGLHATADLRSQLAEILGRPESELFPTSGVTA